MLVLAVVPTGQANQAETLSRPGSLSGRPTSWDHCGTCVFLIVIALMLRCLFALKLLLIKNGVLGRRADDTFWPEARLLKLAKWRLISMQVLF